MARTALEAPKRTAFKPRSAPSSGRALLAVARLLITRRQCSPSSPNPGAAWSRSNLGRAAGGLDCPGGAQDADPGVGRACAEPEVRIHLPPADSLSLFRNRFRRLRTRLSARVCADGLATASAETRGCFDIAPPGGNVSVGPT